jgi:hypothetical protein
MKMMISILAGIISGAILGMLFGGQPLAAIFAVVGGVAGFIIFCSGD